MKINLILFNSGAGGNFLSRVLTLDTVTFPLGGVSHGVPTAQQRFEKYRYGDQFAGFRFNEPLSNGFSKWVDMELTQYYFPLSSGMETLIEKDLVIIEAIHPHHYEEKLALFGPDDQIQHFYIDPRGCEDWIIDQQFHKGVLPATVSKDRARQYLLENITVLKNIVTTVNCYPISLTNVIQDQDSFLLEYVKICQILEVRAYENYATKIYQSWKTTWA